MVKNRNTSDNGRRTLKNVVIPDMRSMIRDLFGRVEILSAVGEELTFARDIVVI